jgi:RimJ/RimL family protein N-acetyltransferase
MPARHGPVPDAPLPPPGDQAIAAMPVLTGGRVRLRPFGPDDICDTYLGWLHDPEVLRYSNQRFVQHSRATCQRYLDSFAGTANHFISVRLAGDDRPIGTLTAYRSLPHGTVDIGILMGERSVWGQGLGLDAFSTLVQWWLTVPGIRKITAGTLRCNVGMLRVAERAGLALEAVRPAQELVDGVPTDLCLYARFTGAGSCTR